MNEEMIPELVQHAPAVKLNEMLYDARQATQVLETPEIVMRLKVMQPIVAERLPAI